MNMDKVDFGMKKEILKFGRFFIKKIHDIIKLIRRSEPPLES